MSRKCIGKEMLAHGEYKKAFSILVKTARNKRSSV